jgi:transposase-like protein
MLLAKEGMMKDFPKTLLEFQSQFPDEEACWQALREMRWPEGFVCPRCGHGESYWIATRRLAQCQTCRYQASVTAGTVFHKTRVPLRIWFWAIFFVARHKQGISALQLQRDTGLGSYQTAWVLLHKVRSALWHRASDRLEGLVEVDETYVGSTRERGLRGGREVGHKTIVGGAVEQRPHTAGSARLSVLEGITFEDDLGPFVRGVIDATEATVRSDGLASYLPLGEVGVHHDRRIQGPNRAHSTKILPWVHLLFANLKAWIRGTFHGVSKKHMQRYLDEFVYRFNRRWREGELFGFVLARLLESGPFPYHRVTAELVG